MQSGDPPGPSRSRISDAAAPALAEALRHDGAARGPNPRAPSETDPTQDLAAALHEVSNALTVLLGWADAARSMTDPRSIAAALDVVAARAAGARDIARRAIGGAEPPAPPLPIAAIVTDAALGLAMEAKRSGVSIASNVAPEVAAQEVPSSPRSSSILTNLLLNAIAFSPRGAAVGVEAIAGPDGCVLLRVDDEGPGIAPERRARLFESGVSSRRGGAGIGLRHSAALAAREGGELRLVDTKQGTRFELEWPCAAAERVDLTAPPTSTTRERPSIDGARILVVEDDDAVIELLELALEARGASVVSVRARAELQVALESGRFDAALLDMSPLIGDVEGAVAELRRFNPDARLVVMSGSVVQANVHGAALWVRKPFEVREIVDALGSPSCRAPLPGAPLVSPPSTGALSPGSKARE